jgi:ABC-type bacteriocin/lantibiotic exporter with double-glycine peptidase domain
VRASGAVARCFALLARCAEALAEPVELDDATRPAMPALHGAIHLDGVVVRHGRRFTLGPIDLEITAGETVAIVGESGAGKSTLLDLIAGLREPTEGRVRFDDRDVAAHRRATARAQIALLTQEPFLFPGTVADNVRFGRLDAADDDVRHAARIARIDDFIARLPEGYASRVERRGANLSVGQRQRIALARALVREPAILLLDEPTSALDAESERSLVQSLREARRGRTCVIVTHRPALLALADRIVELRDGRIAAASEHALEESLA